VRNAILQPDLMLVPDALQDPRFVHNPLVTGAPNIRFYAGAPLMTPDGFAVGTLCVLDHMPREFSTAQARALRALSSQVVALLENRKGKRELAGIAQIENALREANQFNKEIIEGAAQGIIVYDSQLRYVLFNPFMQRLTGKSAEEVLGNVAMDVFPRLRVSGVEEILRRALSGEIIHADDIMVPRHSADGLDVWESCTFAPHLDARGNIVGVIGLVHDVTDRHLQEETFRNIVIGTAAATGADFFPSLVRHLASALRVRYAFVTDCDDQKHAKSVRHSRPGFVLPGAILQKVRQRNSRRVARHHGPSHALSLARQYSGATKRDRARRGPVSGTRPPTGPRSSSP
jgi:PAS domain S-box-containing protein